MRRPGFRQAPFEFAPAQMWYGRAAAQGDKAVAKRVSEMNADRA
jgi:hypothetical protein